MEYMDRHRVAPTTIRIPPDTLAKVDAAAKDLDMTRNSFIVSCITRVVNDVNTYNHDAEIPGQMTVEDALSESEPSIAAAAQAGVDEVYHPVETRHLHHYAPIDGDEYYRNGVRYGTFRCECGQEKTDKLP